MAVRTRIDPFDRDIQLLINEALSPAARSAMLADFASQELAKGQARNMAALGRVPEHETIVDERRGAAVQTVKPDGTIVFEFQLIETALAEIHDLLMRHSPVKTGQFRASHVMFADGVETDPLRPVMAAEYAFINMQPYARKIERGLSPKAPEGVYQVVSVLASKRYGNLARISFSFRSIPSGAAVSKWAVRPSAQALARRVRGGPAHKHHDWLTRQPAVIVKTRQ